MAGKVTPHLMRPTIPGTVQLQARQDPAGANCPEGRRQKVTFTQNQRPAFTNCVLLSYGGGLRIKTVRYEPRLTGS